MIRKLSSVAAASAIGLGLLVAAPTTANASAPEAGVTSVVSASALPQNPAANKRVLFVHGYQALWFTKDCKDWDSMKNYFVKKGYQKKYLRTFGFYKGNKNCSTNYKYSTSTSIVTVAKALSKHIYSYYTSKGLDVTVVAHSMGGLVTRRALMGAKNGWPGYAKRPISVRNVVTLGTPHNGQRSNSCDAYQCRQMRNGSDFQVWMKKKHLAGQDNGKGGTQYTAVGSYGDGTVDQYSATSLHGKKHGYNKGPKHKIRFDHRCASNPKKTCYSKSDLGHSELWSKGAGTGYRYHVNHNYGKDGYWKEVKSGAGPIRMAYLGARYSTW